MLRVALVKATRLLLMTHTILQNSRRPNLTGAEQIQRHFTSKKYYALKRCVK